MSALKHETKIKVKPDNNAAMPHVLLHISVQCASSDAIAIKCCLPVFQYRLGAISLTNNQLRELNTPWNISNILC